MALQSPPKPAAAELPATALYCYGITAVTAAKAQPGAGLGGEAVGTVHCGELAALVSGVPPGTVRARRRDLMTHFDVLGEAFEHGTVLPLRFGIVFDDGRALVDEFLCPRHDELARLLRELEGLVELRVTAHYREDAILGEAVRENPRIGRLREATRGRAAGHPVMLELGELVSAEVQARTARDARALLERLRPLVRRYELDEEPIAYQLLRASFLVERKRVKTFDRALEKFASENPGRVDVKLVGPLPPHSFVELSHGGRR
jgi:Gas vesicle synthesis protein GvpL/GvpF